MTFQGQIVDMIVALMKGNLEPFGQFSKAFLQRKIQRGGQKLDMLQLLSTTNRNAAGLTPRFVR